MIYFLSKKSEVIEKLKEYVNFTTNKFGKKPETIRSDNGGEYMSKNVEEFLKENGIHHQLTVPHCPAQNRVAERKNRTLIEMTRTLLSEANLDKKLWGEALNTANYLQNRLPTKATTKTPYELWHGSKPNLNHLKTFGCKAYAYIHKSKRGKLDDKAQEGIFVGYDNSAKAYRIYLKNDHVILARTVKFIENTINNSGENNEIKLLSENNTNEHSDTESHIGREIVKIDISSPDQNITSEHNTNDTLRRSNRHNKGVPPERLIYLTENFEANEPKDYNDFLNITNPQEKQNWLNAMQEEMNSLIQNKTFTLVEPPPGRKVIGSKWTYKVKYDSSGKIAKYKARLVAKGFSQKYGEDFHETFAPVVSHSTIRAFLASAAHRNRQVHHIDIKTAFLHGDLDEIVYMEQPKGYISPGNENKVWKLEKALYGLKQAARSWHLKIGETLKEFGFTQSTADACLFRKNETNPIHIIIYVDDLLISGSDQQIEETIEKLSEKYELKNLGEISYYLGINIQKSKQGEYFINQRSKIKELVEKFNLQNAKPTNIPMNPGYLDNASDDNLLNNNTKYRQAIGSLLYIATISRPDIAAAVNILSRRNEKPRQQDWDAAKKIICYLKTTEKLNLVISGKEKPILTCYADADWAGDKSDRKSMTGNLFLVGKTPIQWTSKKQTCVALSSAEAEFVSAANAGQEILWLTRVLEDLDLPQELPIRLFEDNQSAIKMIESPKHTARSKHIDIRFHCVKNLCENGTISLQYLQSKLMTADVLTKPTPKPIFLKHRDNLELRQYSSFEEG